MHKWIIVLFVFFNCTIYSFAAGQDNLIEEIKQKNSTIWNEKLYGHITYSYNSSSTIQVLNNNSPIYVQKENSIVTFSNGSSSVKNVKKNKSKPNIPDFLQPIYSFFVKEIDDNDNNRRIDLYLYPPFLNDKITHYKYKKIREEKLENYNCYVLHFITNLPSSNPKFISGYIWIDKKSLLMVQYKASLSSMPYADKIPSWILGFITNPTIEHHFFLKDDKTCLSDKVIVTASVNMIFLKMLIDLKSTQSDYLFYNP